MGVFLMRFVLTTLAILSASTALMANDTFITGGRVIDPETGLDAIRYVAIEGDAVIAATGHVVSPGFIMQ
jgi:N-acyl-D-glutamate deacylase